MQCDDIEWLVDLLGTMALLEYVIQDKTAFPVKDLSTRGQEKSDFKGGHSPDGLYFCDGHWYSVRNGLKTDSYTLKYQKKGTAHFCQTFATMIFVGQVTELKPEQYAHNIRVAMAFWIALFKSDAKIANWFVKEIKTSSHAKNNTSLAQYNENKVLLMLQDVADNADSLVGCTQG